MDAITLEKTTLAKERLAARNSFTKERARLDDCVPSCDPEYAQRQPLFLTYVSVPSGSTRMFIRRALRDGKTVAAPLVVYLDIV